MIFKLLAILTGIHYKVTEDIDTVIADLYQRVHNNHAVYVQIQGPAGTDYVLDLDKLMLRETLPNTVITIKDLLENYLTPQLLYSYATTEFNFNKFIRSFSISDIEGTTLVSACNKDTGETVTRLDDPDYDDIVMSNPDFPLSDTLPIIDGKIYPCTWVNDAIYIKGKAKKLLFNPPFSFLSLTEASTVEIRPLTDMANGELELPAGKVVLVVLNGRLIYDDPFVSTYGDVLTIDPEIVNDRDLGMDEYVTFDDMLYDDSSFVVLLDCTAIRTKVLPVVKLDDKVYQYVTWYNPTHHSDFICLDKDTNKVKDFASVSSKYHDVKKETDPYTHIGYIEEAGSDVKMLQMLIV